MMLISILTSSVLLAAPNPTKHDVVVPDVCAKDVKACLTDSSNFLTEQSDMSGDERSNTLYLIGQNRLYPLISGRGDGIIAFDDESLNYETFWAGLGVRMYIEAVNQTTIYQYEQPLDEEALEEQKFQHVKTYIVRSASSQKSCQTNIIITSSDTSKSTALSKHQKTISALMDSFDFDKDPIENTYHSYSNLLVALRSPLRNTTTMTGVLATDDIDGLTKGLFVVVGGAHSDTRMLQQRLQKIQKNHPKAYIKSITIPNCIYQ